LKATDMERICAKMLDDVAKRALSRGIMLRFGESTAKSLCESVRGEDAGARPLRRKITTEIEDMLSLQIVTGELPDNACAEVVCENGSYRVKLLKHAG
ncbi:MAG: hypothetical protein K2N06_06105, partial [Oscillospiraceae bacterium]|nr:hypothetical protein [Oscillospiraceae bacterium]